LSIAWEAYFRGLEAVDPEFAERARRVVEKPQDWLERLPPSERTDVRADAVWLYTSSLGYDRIFKTVYDIFRSEGPISESVLLATFLVEILNIDLYNYWATHPEVQHYEGVVYRGMSVSCDAHASFVNLAQLPVGSRSFSIPLALNSSSTSEAQAIPFMEYGLEKHSDYVPLLHKIHVRGLSEKRLGLYRKHFRESVVSTICAVPIDAISAYRSEAEVLLRGPFFELLSVHEHPTLRIKEKPVQVLEMAMLNSNRDHYTTPQTGTGDPARTLFNALVKAQKLEVSAETAQAAGLHDDAAAYRALVEQAERAVEEAVS
jgi:hypothetical protein